MKGSRFFELLVLDTQRAKRSAFLSAASAALADNAATLGTTRNSATENEPTAQHSARVVKPPTRKLCRLTRANRPGMVGVLERVGSAYVVQTARRRLPAVLKMLALQVASEYLRAEGVRSPQVNQTLARDLRRPLISAWNLVIQRTLPALCDAGVTLFTPELESAYQNLESKCRDRFLVTTTYEDAAGETRTRTKKLGKIQALISYRNSLAHGFNQSRNRAQSEVRTYLPLLRDILQETSFLARYELWYIRTAGGRTEGVRLHGVTPASRFTPIEPAGPGSITIAIVSPESCH